MIISGISILRAMFREHFFDCSVSSSLFYLHITSLVRLRLRDEPLGFNKFLGFLDFYLFSFFITSQQSGPLKSLLSVLAEAGKVGLLLLANHEKGFAKKLHFFRKNKGCVIFANLLRCCCYFRNVKKSKNFRKNCQ
jgi:hypothetical protein